MLLRTTPFSRICWIAFAVPAFGIAVYYGTLAARMWLRSRVVLGPVSHRTRISLHRLIDISKQGDSLRLANTALLYCVLGALLVAIVAREWLGIVVAAGPLVLIAWLHVRTTTPPAALILGASTHSSLKRQRAINVKLSPLRAISLLDVDVPWDVSLARKLTLDCLRTNNQDDWWFVIRHLMRVVPILVLDAGAETAGVLREGRYIFDAELTWKCLFLVPTNGFAPILDHLLPEPEMNRQSLQIAHYEEAPRAIAAMVAQIIRRRSQMLGHKTPRDPDKPPILF